MTALTPTSPNRQIAHLAVPVSLEFVFQLLLGVIDQVIVGGLGAVAVAAVGLAHGVSFIFVLALGTLGGSAAILIARAFGANRSGDVDRTIGSALTLGTLLSALCAAVLIPLASPILHLAGGHGTVADAATPFLRVSGLALVPAVIGAVLSGALRSLGHPRLPMIATLISMTVNTTLGYALVFGFGPIAALGVVGAAWATFAAYTIKALLLAYQVYGPRQLARPALPRAGARRAILAPLLSLAAPLAVTEVAWSVGTFLYTVVFARLGVTALAASQIVNTLEGLFIVGSIGLTSAATTLIGQAVGRADASAARAWVARVTHAGLITSLAFGALFALTALLIPLLYPKLGDDVRGLAVLGILINAAFQVFKVRNMVLGAGVLPSAGDARGVILGDVVGAFVVGLPLALFSVHAGLGVAGVFAARGAEEVAKVLVFRWRQRRVNWDALAAEGQPRAAH